VDTLADLPGPSLRLRTATLASSTSGLATITLSEETITDVPYLASYAPAVGDIVQVLQTPSQLLILGRAAS
jgi:exosome complex RNA-binding protein Rrp4